MNLLTNTATMSSREISELTGKRHADVMRDIRNMCDALSIPQNADLHCDQSGPNGKFLDFYKLSEDLTITLVTGYSIKLRHNVIKRWQELESNQAPAIPQTYAAALIEAGRLAQVAEDQAEQLAIAAPKVAFVDELVNRDNLMTATQVGQKHKMSAIKLNRFLDELGGVYSKRVERGRVFLQPFINKGYGELKQNNTGHDQPLFTNKGEIWINEQLAAKGDG